jgi:hypothetical protein
MARLDIPIEDDLLQRLKAEAALKNQHLYEYVAKILAARRK